MLFAGIGDWHAPAARIATIARAHFCCLVPKRGLVREVRVKEETMNRREFLKLGGVTGGVIALGSAWRLGSRAALAQSGAMPTVDRLVMTTVVDNFYDAFARGGKLETITVQRTLLPPGRPLMAEH